MTAPAAKPAIFFTTEQINQIGAAAEAAYPEECCGLLAGRVTDDGYRVSRVIPAANVIETRAHDRFEVDPQVRIDLMRELRGTDEEMIGHYHSHPDHGAFPSDTDRSMAYEPALVWVITSVLAGQARETAAHLYDPESDAFTEVEVRVDGALAGF